MSEPKPEKPTSEAKQTEFPEISSFKEDIAKELCQIMAVLIEKTKRGEISWKPQDDHHLVKSCVSGGPKHLECKIERFVIQAALNRLLDCVKGLKEGLNGNDNTRPGTIRRTIPETQKKVAFV